MSEIPQILMLSAAHNEDLRRANQVYAQSLNERLGEKATVRVVHYNDIGFIFEAGSPRAFLIDGQRSLEDISLVYFKSYINSYGSLNEQASALATCLTAQHIPFIEYELTHTIALTKLSQYAKLTAAGLPVPKSMFVAPSRLALAYELFEKSLGVPFVLKDIGGFGGQFNFLIKDKAHFEQVIAESPEVAFIAQTFIANDGDLRVWVIADEIKMIIGRKRADNTTHLNNTSQGGQATLVSLADMPSEVIADCVRAAGVFNREVAGVDVVVNKSNGRHYFFEVNRSPQIESGQFATEKAAVLADYLSDLTN